jgi:hypothetical protein
LRAPERSRREPSRRGFTLRLAVSLALVLLLFLFVDWSLLGARLGAADPLVMLGIVGLATAVRVGALVGAGRTAVLVASVVLERLVGALAQAVLAALSVATLVALGLGARIGPAERWGLGAAVALAFAAFPFTFPAARRVAARLGPGPGWRGALRALAEQYAGYGASTGLVCVFFALTLLEGGFPIAIHYAAGRALGLDPGWSFYLATVPLVFLVARLPVSLGGIGFLELSFVSLAGLLGMGWTDAFAIAGLATALYVIALLPGAVLYLIPAAAVRPAPRERLP